MCKEQPEHKDLDVIVGKIWLIGRSYAAAIERRKNAVGGGDDFYYEVVAPKLLEIGPELDDRLSGLRKSKGQIVDDYKEILSTHKFLMDIFYELTGVEKRSLASKYLHFHCLEKFFIYDSRARTGIGKLVKKPGKGLLNTLGSDPFTKGKQDFDYADVILISVSRKVTNLITYFDFIQTEKVTDVMKGRNLIAYFATEDGEKISFDVPLVANIKDDAPDKRTFHEKFTLKSREYKREDKYYMHIVDANDEKNILHSYEFMIDIALVEDFGF